MVSKQGKENKIRLGVKKMGCNGFSYFFEFVNRPNKSDQKLFVENLEFLIPNDSVNIIKGSQVDFAIEGLNQGVRFMNPNANAVCGCGESFTVMDEDESSYVAVKKK